MLVLFELIPVVCLELFQSSPRLAGWGNKLSGLLSRISYLGLLSCFSDHQGIGSAYITHATGSWSFVKGNAKLRPAGHTKSEVLRRSHDIGLFKIMIEGTMLSSIDFNDEIQNRDSGMPSLFLYPTTQPMMQMKVARSGTSSIIDR